MDTLMLTVIAVATAVAAVFLYKAVGLLREANAYAETLAKYAKQSAETWRTGLLDRETEWLMGAKHALMDAAAASGGAHLVILRDGYEYDDEESLGPYVAAYWKEKCPEVGADDDEYEWIFAIGLDIRDDSEKIWMKVNRDEVSEALTEYVYYTAHPSGSDVMMKAREMIGALVAEKRKAPPDSEETVDDELGNAVGPDADCAPPEAERDELRGGTGSFKE